MKALHLRVTGRVQGVGYRAFLEAEATKLGLDGWARNRRDGSVEAAVSGGEVAVDAFVLTCRRGPRGAAVKLVEIETHSGPLASGFVILPTR
jgi:acylphosphatase